MIQRLSAGIVGLLAFTGMLLAGYLADNPFSTIVLRALLGLTGGLIVGYTVGFIAQVIINEHVTNLVQTDAQAELVQSAGGGEEKVEKAKKETGEARENKENRQASREETSRLLDGTLSAKAAEALFSET